MSSDLKQIFASQNFLGGERYVFLFDTLVGRNFFQGGVPPPGKKICPTYGSQKNRTFPPQTNREAINCFKSLYMQKMADFFPPFV